MFNIITERFVRMTVADGVRSASLPEVFAALMTNEVEAFPALRPHQRHAWHAFLVQLGAMTMHRAGRTTPPSARALALVTGRSARCFCPAHPGCARSTPPPRDTRTQPARHTAPDGQPLAPAARTRGDRGEKTGQPGPDTLSLWASAVFPQPASSAPDE